jgi:hypothetical protein
MGYRGKVIEQQRARQLRAESRTLADIASELGIAKSSVSLWVRDVEFVPSPRRTGARRRPNVLQRRKAGEIEAMQLEGMARLGQLDEQSFLAAGAALYAGEGAKRDGSVRFANSDPRMISLFLKWLRHFFTVDDPSMRNAKHPMGCPSICFGCSKTHRAVMGLVAALLSSERHSGVAQLAERRPVKPMAEGPSPSPGAQPG